MKLEFVIMCKAALLSQYITTRCECATLNFFSNEINHVASQVADARVLYLAFADDRDTMVYFLKFQEMSESSRNIQNPMTDL